MRVDPQERYEYWVRYLARARPAWGVLLLDYVIERRDFYATELGLPTVGELL